MTGYTNNRGILVLTSSYPKNSGDYSGRFVAELSERLSSIFDIYVLAPHSPGAFQKEKYNNLRIVRYKYWFGKKLVGDGETMSNLKHNKWMYLQVIPFVLCQLISLSKLVKENNIIAIHAHWLIPQSLIAVIYKKFFNKKIKVLATAHGGDINNFAHFWNGRLLKFIFKNIDGLTVVSQAIKNKVLEQGYEKEIKVYPMGINTKLFSPDKKKSDIKKYYKIDGPLILFVGGIIYRKGINELIEAMPSIIKKHPKTKLIAIGEGNLKNKMIERVKELRIEQSVIFIGAISHKELPAYFATADVFVLPSRSEGFGLAVAEAISCSTLAIASNLKPINDIIIENKTGFYFEGIDNKSISDKIIEVLRNDSQFNNIKIQGRKHILENFDWDIVSKNYTIKLSKLLPTSNLGTPP